MKSQRFSIAVVITVLLHAVTAVAGDATVTGWREFRNGGSSHSIGPLPTVWSAEKGITWQKELPGYGQSSPLIFHSKVFVTAVIGPMKDECAVVCLDLKTGETLWTWQQGTSTKTASNYMASRAAPTPIVDEDGAYAFFESGDLIGLNLDGTLKWNRSLTTDYGKFENNHGLGSSPTQTKDLIVLNIEHKGPSYLVAVEKSSGKTAWKVERPSGSSWTSPIVIQYEGRDQIIVSSGGAVSSYDPADGKQLWTVGGFAGNSVPSPTAVGPYLFVGARIPEFGSGQEASRSNLCLKLDSSNAGTHEVIWRASKAVCDYASPVVDRDCAYYLNSVGVLYCIDSATGETNYTERLGTTCWATPIVAFDNVFFFGKDGTTQVISGGPTFTRVATNLLWDPKNPPRPDSYTEHQGSHGHAAEQSAVAADKKRSDSENAEPTVAGNGAAESQGGPSAGAEGGHRRGPGAGMAAMLMKSDANGDGKISADELPAEFKDMLSRVDLNKDNVIDAEELNAMEESFRKRREGSRESARDPIVYGVAADQGVLVIRTGTRLYCVQGER